LLGANGAGKTTLIRAVTGLLDFTMAISLQEKYNCWVKLFRVCLHIAWCDLAWDKSLKGAWFSNT
jgi:ABC-type transport system involved in cytochrome c biogenesis ATPase subunit